MVPPEPIPHRTHLQPLRCTDSVPARSLLSSINPPSHSPIFTSFPCRLHVPPAQFPVVQGGTFSHDRAGTAISSRWNDGGTTEERRWKNAGRTLEERWKNAGTTLERRWTSAIGWVN